MVGFLEFSHVLYHNSSSLTCDLVPNRSSFPCSPGDYDDVLQRAFDIGVEKVAECENVYDNHV